MKMAWRKRTLGGADDWAALRQRHRRSESRINGGMASMKINNEIMK
jgi:hypothetical protein